jgi:hypothetical protein
MADQSTRIDANWAQSKLQENSFADSPSVPTSAADYRASPAPKGRDTDSPRPYIVGDSSSPHTPIPFHHVENVIQAAAFARTLGLPLFHHLTIRWPNGDWRFHEDILRAVAEWQRYHVGQAAFVWTKEANGYPHSHFLLHLPAEKSLKFRAMVMKKLKRLAGRRSLPAGTVQCRRVWSRGYPLDHMRNRVAYILKRTDEGTRQILGVGKRDFGHIDGKQVGVSQSLGQAARSRQGSVMPSGHRRCPLPDRHKRSNDDRPNSQTCQMITIETGGQ